MSDENGERVLSRVKRSLPSKMTTEGFGLAGVRLATLLQKHGEFELQAKGVRDGLKTQEAAIQGDIDTQANAIRSGVEMREVEVEILADYGTGMVSVVRLDTSETITTRKLTDEERQRKMVFDVEELDEEADEAIANGKAPKMDAKKIAEALFDKPAAPVPTDDEVKKYWADREPPANEQ